MSIWAIERVETLRMCLFRWNIPVNTTIASTATDLHSSAAKVEPAGDVVQSGVFLIGDLINMRPGE